MIKIRCYSWMWVEEEETNYYHHIFSFIQVIRITLEEKRIYIGAKITTNKFRLKVVH